MRLKDLIPGEYYYTTFGSSYILQATVTNRDCDNLVNGHFCKGIGGFDIISDDSFRLATPQEKLHLQACQKAGKYVEAPPDMEYILREAKEKYPEGTEFLSAYSGNPKIVEGALVIDRYNTGIRDERGNYIYDEGKWGILVLKSEFKQLPIFN